MRKIYWFVQSTEGEAEGGFTEAYSFLKSDPLDKDMDDEMVWRCMGGGGSS